MDDELPTLEQQKATLNARYDYMSILAAGLRKWAIIDDDEQKRMDSLLRAIEKYRLLLVESYSKLG